MGIIEPLLGITKLAEGINKPYLGDFVISSAASEAKTSIVARTPAKAVDSYIGLTYSLSELCNTQKGLNNSLEGLLFSHMD